MKSKFYSRTEEINMEWTDCTTFRIPY